MIQEFFYNLSLQEEITSSQSHGVPYFFDLIEFPFLILLHCISFGFVTVLINWPKFSYWGGRRTIFHFLRKSHRFQNRFK